MSDVFSQPMDETAIVQEGFTNILITSALDTLAENDPTLFYRTTRSTIESELQQALQRALPQEFSLQSNKPDFEAIIFQMTQELQSKPTWKDILTAGVGQTILRNIAAGVGLLHFAIVRATQEVMLRPESSRSGVYEAMNFLGVEPRRKEPGKLKATLTIPDHQDAFIVPALTQFSVRDTKFFNRESITYTEFNVSQNVELVQGTLFKKEGVAQGIPYERIVVGYENFAISNSDIYVWVNGQRWEKSTSNHPWQANSRDKIFFTKTLSNGNVEIMFGNNVFARKLGVGDQVKIIWAETSDASTVPDIVGHQFLNQNLPLDVTGTITSAIFGYDDELPIELYKEIGPHIRSAQRGVAKRSDWTVTALQYPQVRDAVFRGQAELAPGKRNWMNVVEATVLSSTGDILSDNNWEEFLEFMHKNSLAQFDIIRRNPLIYSVNLTADIYCRPETNLFTLETLLRQSLRDFNKPKRGSLGYSIYASDLANLLEGEYLPEQYKSQIEYARSIRATNIPSPDNLVTVTGSEDAPHGVTADGDILARPLEYIRFVDISLNMKYTTRRTLGRRDLSSSLVDPG